MEKFKDAVYLSSGTIPFIITVRDDGILNSLDGKNILPLTENPKENDTGTRKLAYLIRKMSENSIPFFALQRVERKRLSKEIRLYYYQQVLWLAYKCLNYWHKCYLIDLHAFGEQRLDFGLYDIIFGTDHRHSVADDFDTVFAKRLTSNVFNMTKDLRIYIPGEAPIPGERFGATKLSTITKWVKTQEPLVNAIQMEVYREWLASEPKLVALALEISRAISSFLKTN